MGTAHAGVLLCLLRAGILDHEEARRKRVGGKVRARRGIGRKQGQGSMQACTVFGRRVHSSAEQSSRHEECMQQQPGVQGMDAGSWRLGVERGRGAARAAMLLPCCSDRLLLCRPPHNICNTCLCSSTGPGLLLLSEICTPRGTPGEAWAKKPLKSWRVVGCHRVWQHRFARAQQAQQQEPAMLASCRQRDSRRGCRHVSRTAAAAGA